MFPLIPGSPGTIKYELTPKGIESIAAILFILSQVALAILSINDSPWKKQRKEEFTRLEQTLFYIQENCEKLSTLRHMKLTA